MSQGEPESLRGRTFRSRSLRASRFLEARAGRQTLVREYLADATPEILAQPRKNPHDSSYEETVLSCLRTILEEEWEHDRYAVRDLDTLAAQPSTQ